MTLLGSNLQHSTKASTSFLWPLIASQATYSCVILFLVFSYHYIKTSLKSLSEKVALKGIIEVRGSSIAECNETANLSFTSSLVIFLIILGTPDVDAAIRFRDTPKPSGKLIMLMALRTPLSKQSNK
jgi:hypothetical protein